jgi:hypothetical protein
MSSTTSTFITLFSLSNSKSIVSVLISAVVFLKLKVKLNVAPSLILLVTEIVPPCFSTNCLEIPSPNPVPPNILEDEFVAC